MLTAAARKPSSRHGEPVEPEVDALDERVLRDDEPVGELGRVVLGADDQPAATRARAAGRAHRLESSIDRRPERLDLGDRADHGDAGRAGADALGRVRASIPPIATTGIETERQMSRSPSRPIGASASGFDGVSQIGPAPR